MLSGVTAAPVTPSGLVLIDDARRSRQPERVTQVVGRPAVSPMAGGLRVVRPNFS
jgi:hypothetical protein